MNPSSNGPDEMAAVLTRLRRITLLGVWVSVVAVWVTVPVFVWFPSTLTGLVAIANTFGLFAMLLGWRHAKRRSSEHGM